MYLEKLRLIIWNGGRTFDSTAILSPFNIQGVFCYLYSAIQQSDWNASHMNRPYMFQLKVTGWGSCVSYTHEKLYSKFDRWHSYLYESKFIMFIAHMTCKAQRVNESDIQFLLVEFL